MKKRFMALPIVGIVVAMLGSAVFASSPGPGTPPIEVDGAPIDDIIIYEGDDIMNVMGKKATDLIGESELQAAVNKKDKSIKASDMIVSFVFTGYYRPDIWGQTPHIEVHHDFGHDVMIRIGYNSDPSDVLIVLHYVKGRNETVGKWVIVGENDTTTSLKFTVDSLSPFAVVKGTPKSSSQTGEYAGTYIIMVATALVACGAVFAIRAKKASK